MEKPDVHVLQSINWQFFGTLTFKQASLPERVRLSMYFALVRNVCKWHRAYFPDLPWCLRMELGELLGRRHFHCLIAGLPRHAVTTETCFSIMLQWERIGGGWARVTVFDPTLNGEGYILKCLGEKTDAGDFYESSKFAGNCELMLSKSVERIAAAKARRGTLRW